MDSRHEHHNYWRLFTSWAFRQASACTEREVRLFLRRARRVLQRRMGHFACEEIFYVLVEYRFDVLVEYRCHFVHGADPFLDGHALGLHHGSLFRTTFAIRV